MKRDPETIQDLINDEEAQFLKTLVRGRILFQRAVRELPTGETCFPGMLSNIGLERNINVFATRPNFV